MLTGAVASACSRDDFEVRIDVIQVDVVKYLYREGMGLQFRLFFYS